MTGTLPEAVSSVIWRFGHFDYGISQTLLETLKPGGFFLILVRISGFFPAGKLAGWQQWTNGFCGSHADDLRTADAQFE